MRSIHALVAICLLLSQLSWSHFVPVTAISTSADARACPEFRLIKWMLLIFICCLPPTSEISSPPTHVIFLSWNNWHQTPFLLHLRIVNMFLLTIKRCDFQTPCIFYKLITNNRVPELSNLSIQILARSWLPWNGWMVGGQTWSPCSIKKEQKVPIFITCQFRKRRVKNWPWLQQLKSSRSSCGHSTTINYFSSAYILRLENGGNGCETSSASQ